MFETMILTKTTHLQEPSGDTINLGHIIRIRNTQARGTNPHHISVFAMQIHQVQLMSIAPHIEPMPQFAKLGQEGPWVAIQTGGIVA